jgi:hypothetical protein
LELVVRSIQTRGGLAPKKYSIPTGGKMNPDQRVVGGYTTKCFWAGVLLGYFSAKKVPERRLVGGLTAKKYLGLMAKSLTKDSTAKMVVKK